MKKTILFTILSAVILILIAVNICMGSVEVAPGEILLIIAASDRSS